MHTDQIVIATISLARSAEEERLLKNALTQLSSLNLEVIVTDGGSSQSFVDFLQSLPNLTLLKAKAKGLWAQAKTSLQKAAENGKPFIFYTEPDKLDFFKTGLLKMLNAIEVDESLGVLLASRSAKAFASFPSFQQMTETCINNCCEERIGLKTDYCYGPFLLNKKIAPHLDLLPNDTGWGWRPFAFNTAHRLGYKVKAFEDDFFCPEDQREDDAAESLYRMKQLEQNIRGLVMSEGNG